MLLRPFAICAFESVEYRLELFREELVDKFFEECFKWIAVNLEVEERRIGNDNYSQWTCDTKFFSAFHLFNHAFELFFEVT